MLLRTKDFRLYSAVEDKGLQAVEDKGLQAVEDKGLQAVQCC